MATTLLADVFDPQILADMISVALPGQIKLSRTGAVVFDNSLLGSPKGGSIVTLPRWDALGEATVLVEDTEETTEKMTTASETATVQAYGKAVEITDSAKFSSFTDPNQEAANQFAKLIARKVDRSMMFEADDRATSESPSLRNTPGGGLTLAGSSGTDAIAETLAKWKDEEEDNVFIVHSRVYADIRKNNDFQIHNNAGIGAVLVPGGQFQVPSMGVTPVGTILNRPVFVSDLVGTNETAIPTTGTGITAAQTTIPVDSTAGFPPTGELLIESEEVSYTGRTAFSFTGVTRGINATAAVVHAAGITVNENDAGAAATRTYDFMMLKMQSIIFYFQRQAEVESDRDILKRNTIMAITVRGAPHAFKRLDGRSLPGVTILETESTIT